MNTFYTNNLNDNRWSARVNMLKGKRKHFSLREIFDAVF
ncbi:hypothetical protein EZS27_010239 [termite gut metagenome]|uniref:Uncharacterized protein n=1 Tax=termite gut metagenome TaxID=433724 RepID=A0A5J4S810_9ZZZZ